MIVDEARIHHDRRELYTARIRRAIARMAVIDGCDANSLAQELVASFQFALRHHLAQWSHVQTRPFVGLGCGRWIRVRGRIAEKSTVPLPAADDDAFDVLVSCWYRFLIVDMPPTPLRVRRRNKEVLTACDEEGFFDALLSPASVPAVYATDQVEIELGQQALLRAEHAICQVVVPSRQADMAIVVDLDGLVLEHPDNTFARTLAEVVTGNPVARLPSLPGLNHLLRRLAGGGVLPRSMFYISRAPRHIYEHVRAAIGYAGLPEGYLHLRDFEVGLRDDSEARRDASVLDIDFATGLLAEFEETKLVFIGVADRRESYVPLLRRHGDRVLATYLYLVDEDAAEVDSFLSGLDLVGKSSHHGRGFVADAIARGWIKGES